MDQYHLTRDLSTLDPAALAASDSKGDVTVWRAQRPDAHAQVLRDGELVGHASLWWRETPGVEGERLGTIGHFFARDAASATLLLEKCSDDLRAEKCTLAVGPMDGNTWRTYRFVTDFGAEPPFLLEPWNPREWPGYFTAAGFGQMARYVSLLADDLAREDERVPRVEERLARNNVTIRDLRPAEFEEELRRIYEVSLVSFRANVLYTPIDESEFLTQYAKFREKVRPELVLIAERESQPVGYVFGYPDYLEAARGEPGRTAIGKTLAILPGKMFGGLGVVLTQRFHRRARELGFTRVIHALQFEGNEVRNTSEFFGSVMRRYTLFSRRL